MSKKNKPFVFLGEAKEKKKNFKQDFFVGDIIQLPNDPRAWEVVEIERHHIGNHIGSYFVRQDVCILKENWESSGLRTEIQHRRGYGNLKIPTLEIPLGFLETNPQILILSRPSYRAPNYEPFPWV